MPYRIVIGALLAVAIGGATRAEPMTYEQALALARANAPSLKARALLTSAARSAAIAADRLPDPTLDLKLQDFPVNGPDTGFFNRDDFTMTVIGVSQQIPNLAKRHARAARATAEIGIAAMGELTEARTIRLETALAWIDLAYGKRRLAQIDLLDQSLDSLQKTVNARLAAGTARPSQALEPTQLRAQVTDRRSDMIAAIAQARARLTRYTGDPDPEIAGPLPDTAINAELLKASIDVLPAIQALDANTAAADAETRVARADKRPDLTVGASYGRRQPNFGDLLSVGVSIDLPVFAKRRQDPKIAARASEAGAARLTREAGRRDMIAALDADLAGHTMHHDRLANARAILVPIARQRAELDRNSYAAGKTDLGTALLATLALAEAEVDTLNREAEVARDAVRINVTYGDEAR